MPAQDVPAERMIPNQTGARHIFVRPQKTGYLLEGSLDGENWFVLLDTRGEGSDRAHRFWMPEKPVDTRYLRLRDFVIPFGGVPAVSGLRVFGPAQGEAPGQVSRVEASRSGEGLNILLKWDAVPGADGYNVRYGIAPEKLYSGWQVADGTELDLSMVNAGQDYYIVVDSYGSGGVTIGEIFKVEA